LHNEKIMNSFENKVVLVTGGSNGIGHATAAVLADKGATVIICGRDSARGDRAAAELKETGTTSGAVGARQRGEYG
jgi:NAD(P)-dependent dehydrogenase (short-subunit alcohol dehydrogenase family)